MKKLNPIQSKSVSLVKKSGRIAKRLPRLETMFEDDGDPLEAVEYEQDNLEVSADREMTEIVRQIKESKQESYETFRIARDPEYWLALCFQSRDQRDDFLSKSGWAAPGEKYLNGLEIARRLGIDIPFTEIKPLKLRGKPKKYTKKEVI